MPLANYLKMLKRQQVLTLLALGWSFRRIERETGVRRETISQVRPTGPSNPAKMFPGSEGPTGHGTAIRRAEDGSNPAKTFPGSGSNPAKMFPGSEAPAAVCGAGTTTRSRRSSPPG